MTQSSPPAALALIRTLVGALTHSARGIESATGLTNAQLFLMRQLAVAGTLSVGELAARIHARQNSVSSVLRHLVDGGLVRKTQSPDDARRAVLALTSKGKRLEQRAPKPPAETLLHALTAITERERRSLVAGLQALTAAMNLQAEDAPMLFEDR